MSPATPLHILREVQRGALTPEAAVGLLRPVTDLGYARIDDHRAARTGLAEVIYGEGKTPEQIAGILEHLVSAGQPALATRVSPEKAAAARALLPGATYEPVPRLLWAAPEGHRAFAPTQEGKVCVISGGTADLPVAEEAARCAEWFGLEVERAWDVGVSGLHRLLSRLDGLTDARVIIAVAGMEGALPSVVAGLVRAPIIAVPTSQGYGVHLGGLAPLLTMLDSCAAGVSVVNIDNGFGAALVAWRMVARR
ncbi:MAG: nickel pincer cofactor biosynthesis protein LarB [Deltaproteobacteria bacterium]|nr:nickel pincer cofactor biosynthesis protein LarB [Deltaproteobacteria bacterium]